MALATGQVTTVERVGSVQPSRRIVDVGRALSRHRRRGPRRRARRSWRRPGRWPAGSSAGDTRGQHALGQSGAGGAQTAQGTTPAGRGAQAQGTEPEAREGSTSARTRRKESGSDLILRNLVSGQEITVPLVSDFEWNRDGSWIAYGVSSPKAEEDGAFARQMSDGSVRTLLKGKGNYKAFGFDEDGRQLAFLSDSGRVRQGRRAVPPLLLEALRRHRVRAGRGDDPRHAVGPGRQRSGHAVVLEGRSAALSRHGAAARSARAGWRARAARRGPVALEGSAAAADAARARPAGAQSLVPRGRPPRRQAVRPARHARDADAHPGRGSRCVRSAPTICRTGRKCRGTPTTATSTWSIRRPDSGRRSTSTSAPARR